MDRQSLVAGFFGEGNAIKIDPYKPTQGLLRTCAAENARFLLETGEPIPLPRQIGSELYWYAFARNGQEALRLAQELEAFVGPSYSDFVPRFYPLNSNDPVENALLQSGYPVGFRFQGAISKAGDSPAVQERAKQIRLELYEALERYRNLCQMRPVAGTESIIAPARALREFYASIAAQDRASAEKVLAYLTTHNLLDPLNIAFLRVHFHASFLEWQAILALDAYRDLVEARRPAAITAEMVRALYCQHLKEYEISGDVEGALREFRSDVGQLSGTLFQAVLAINHPDVANAFLIANAAAEKRKDVAASVLGFWQQEWHGRDWANSFAGLAPNREQTPNRSVTDAWRAYQVSDYDQVQFLLRDLPSSAELVRLCFACADELQSLDLERLAVERFQQLDDLAQAELLALPKYAKVWQRISTPDRTVPANWLEWFEAASDPAWLDERLRQIALQGSGEWPIEALFSDPNTPATIAGLVKTTYSSGTPKRRLMDSLPYLITALTRDPEFARHVGLPLYRELVIFICLEFEAPGAQEYSAAASLLDGLAEMGEDRGLTLDALEFLLHRGIVPRLARSVLEFLDQALNDVDPGDPRVSQAVQPAFVRLHEFLLNGDITEADQPFVLELASSFGFAALFSDFDISHLQATDRGGLEASWARLPKKIGIYTLSEAQGKRAKTLIQNHRPDCEIRLCHDKVETELLREMSRRCAIVVEVIGCAKHAATNAIAANLGQNTQLIKVRQKGAYAVLRALLNWLVDSEQ